ncbi:MAG: response regulator, partial [Verrucomicrobiota bacterium]
DPILRESLGAIIQNAPGFLPPRLFPDLQRALREVLRDPPLVMVVDVKLPGDSGLRFIRMVRSRLPRLRLVVLTAADHEDYLFAALEAGADGYLIKGTNLVEILEKIRRAAAGEPVLSASALRKVVAEYRQRIGGGQMEVRLTPKEDRLLELTDAGWSCEAIAQDLGLSVHTVYALNKALYPRLRVNSRAAAAAAWRRLRRPGSGPGAGPRSQPASRASSLPT